MTALDQLRSLIDRELGTSGWSLTSVENLDCANPDGGVLRTQRGFIPFSTLKMVVEMIPELLEDYSEAVDGAYDDGYAAAKEDYGND